MSSDYPTPSADLRIAMVSLIRHAFVQKHFTTMELKLITVKNIDLPIKVLLNTKIKRSR